MKTILIVESPTKARKIQKYFNNNDTIIKSSFGHIFHLPKSSLSIDTQNNFKPNYQPIPGKEKIIKELYQLRKYNILLAADDDREGDAIAWHCGNLMKVDYSHKNRIIFHEISKKAIMNSIENPTQLNMNSVNAQQARRIIDRLIGFSLSPLLWKHIQTDKKGLSAGRVQSTLLSMLQDHENKIKKFNPEIKNEIISEFKFNDKIMFFEFISNQSNIDPLKLLTMFQNNKRFTILTTQINDEKKYPPLPFITSSLQQSAFHELRFNVKKTMSVAQKLYENGKITYMRTDSHSISKDFQFQIRNLVIESFGENYYKPSSTNKKIKGAQEAHECIRVTTINESLNDKYNQDDHKLYNLIKKRTIISHMKPSIYNVLTIQLTNNDIQNIGHFLGYNKILTFDGFLKYDQKLSCDHKQIEIKQDQIFNLLNCISKLKESNPPSYLNESSIIKTLEKSGVGRPSTYSSIISTLYNRNYTESKTIQNDDKNCKTLTLNKNNQIKESVTKQKMKKQNNCILLTDLGKTVLDYLLKHFNTIINVQFTANVEKDLDLIHEGKIDWIEIIRKVYDSFHKDVQIQMKLSSNKDGKKFNTLHKNLGNCKDKDVFLKKGPYGHYLSYNEKNINLKNHLIKKKCKPENIQLKDIKYLLDYPMNVGKYKKKDIIIYIGPYGKYIKYQNKNYKIPQKDKYSLDECIRIIENS